MKPKWHLKSVEVKPPSRLDRPDPGGSPERQRWRRQCIGASNQLARLLWSVTWALLCRHTPRPLHAWRAWVLRAFGARLGRGARVYPSARIWAPWNLEMGESACIGPDVDCYSVDRISIGARSTVSQYSYLCTASHDYTDPALPLITAPIKLGEDVWVTADVFVGPGVALGDGVVVTARSSIFSDLPPWVVASGNPARVRKPRTMRHEANVCGTVTP